MATIDLGAYSDYREYWKGTGLSVTEANMTARYPNSANKMVAMHLEILTRFADATAGVDSVGVMGQPWAEDPAPRIVEAINIARITGFCALSIGWQDGLPRLDVAWGDQVTAAPDTARSLDDCDTVSVIGSNGAGVQYQKLTDGTWQMLVTRKNEDPEPKSTFAALPVLGIYDGRNRPEEAVPQPRRTLLDQQIAIDLVATDIEHQRANSPNQIWVASQDAGNRAGFHGEVRRGPEYLLELEAGDQIGAIPSNLDLNAQVSYLETLLQILAVTAGLSPTTFLPSRAETGAAKAEESSENTKIRRVNHQAAVGHCKSIEAWLVRVLGPVAITVPPFLIPSSGDPLQTASALDLRWKMGLDSPIEQAIAERGFTEAEAITFVARNQASYRTFGGGTLTPPERQAPDGGQVAETPKS